MKKVLISLPEDMLSTLKEASKILDRPYAVLIRDCIRGNSNLTHIKKLMEKWTTIEKTDTNSQ